MLKTLIVTSLALAPLAAPQVQDKNGTTSGPDVTFEAGIKALRRNDLSTFLKLTLTDEQYAEAKQQWLHDREQGPTPEEAAQLEQALAMLTATGAEDQIFQMLKPKLDEMRPQMAMMAGMFTGMAQAAVQQNAEMTTEEQQKAGEILAKIGELLTKGDLADEAKAKRAIAVVCSTARRLEVKTVADIQKLSFEQLVGKGDILLAGTKDLLRIYGVTVDTWLDSVDATTVKETGDMAMVRVTFEILGVQQTVDTRMVRQNGRWFHDKGERKVSTAGVGLGR